MMWDVSSVVFKVLNLLSVAALIGGAFSLYLSRAAADKSRQHLLLYTVIAAALGLLTTITYFFLEIGAINQAGFSGMFDLQMGLILAQSGLGHTSALRIAGFILALTLLGISTLKPSIALSSRYLLILSLALLALSFAMSGHLVSFPVLPRVAIILHILAASLWIGSLYPLWFLCKVESVTELKIIMQLFGKLAMYFVAVLLVSGIFLLGQLLEMPAELGSTSYGQTMLFKLGAVICLLSLGAINKLRLVPSLDTKGTSLKLQHSITLEMIFALIVLIVTASLTTVIGI